MNELMNSYDGGEGEESGKVISGIGEKYDLKMQRRNNKMSIVSISDRRKNKVSVEKVEYLLLAVMADLSEVKI